MATFRTIIVEDYEAFRRLLRSILQEKTECVVIGEACDGLQAVQQAKELQPDLVLLDMSLPRLNGIEAARQIRKVCPQSKIVFLSQDSSPEIVQGALHLGAAGYLLKSDANELPLAIEAIMQGVVFISKRLKSA
jgi:DNA-binding NarL/FixJ family response regulator